MNLIFIVLVLGVSGVEFHLPKLLNGRLLVSGTDFGAIVSKAKQCFHTQWNFTIDDAEKTEKYGQILKEYCDKIPIIEEFRKEIECEKYRNSKVYDYTENVHKLNCKLDIEHYGREEEFRSEIENIFWFNKLNFASMSSENYPQVWFDAAGFSSEWDMVKSFVKNSVRAHPLYCDEDGVMLEICVPMVHNKIYGDMEMVMDAGAFSPSQNEFVYANLPKTAIHSQVDRQFIGINEEMCGRPFEFGFTCPETSVVACNVTTYENCNMEAVEADGDLTLVREFGNFFLVATQEKETQITNANGDVKAQPVPAPTFLLAIGETDSVSIGSSNLAAIKGTHFSKTQTFNIDDLGEKSDITQHKRKTLIEKWLGFFGKK